VTHIRMGPSPGANRREWNRPRPTPTLGPPSLESRITWPGDKPQRGCTGLIDSMVSSAYLRSNGMRHTGSSGSTMGAGGRVDRTPYRPANWFVSDDVRELADEDQVPLGSHFCASIMNTLEQEEDELRYLNMERQRPYLDTEKMKRVHRRVMESVTSGDGSGRPMTSG